MDQHEPCALAAALGSHRSASSSDASVVFTGQKIRANATAWGQVITLTGMGHFLHWFWHCGAEGAPS